MDIKARFNKLNLRQQINLIVFILFSCFTLIFSVILNWKENQIIVNSKLNEGRAFATFFSNHSVLPLLYGSTDSIEDEINALFKFPEIIHVSIITADGNILLDQGDMPFRRKSHMISLPFQGQLTHEDDKYWHFTADIYTHKTKNNRSPFLLDTPKPEYLGYIVVTMTKDLLIQHTRAILVQNVLITACFFIIIWFAISWFSRFITLPLKHLTQKMEEKELNPISTFEGSSEIIAIANAYNQLIRDLSERQKTLDNKNKELNREIDERIHAEQETRRLQIQLQQAQKMEAIGQLTGGIAHDFNNILASIIGYSTLAQDRFGDMDSKLRQYLDEIGTSGRRARDLVAQMLSFSRGSHSKQSEQNTKILIEETVKMMKPTLPSTIKIITSYGEELNNIVADPIQLTQAVMNLCINARDAMNGRGKIVINVKELLIKHKICNSCHSPVNGYFQEISIRDTGSGITPDILIRIFEPFFSTKDVGKGSGMGLSVVKNIVHELGGHILVESKLHQGTTFKLLFPTKVPSQGVKTKEKYSIGIVDRDASISKFLREMLLSRDYQVKIHNDLAEFCNLDPGTYAYQLLLINISDSESAEKLSMLIKKWSPNGIIAYSDVNLSAFQDQDNLYCIKKPINPNELLDLVERALSNMEGIHP